MSKVKNSLAEQLYKQIKHGDKEHQEWLKEAIFNFFEGIPCPPPRGSGTKDRLCKEVARLQKENEELKKMLSNHH